MARKQFSAEQIISKLREVKVLLSQGQTVAAVVRQLEISEQTYFRLEDVLGPQPARTNKTRTTKGP